MCPGEPKGPVAYFFSDDVILLHIKNILSTHIKSCYLNVISLHSENRALIRLSDSYVTYCSETDLSLISHNLFSVLSDTDCQNDRDGPVL